MPMLKIVSFGSNDEWGTALKRLKTQLLEYGLPESDLFFFSETSPDQDFQDFLKEHEKFIFRSRKGYGYWIWKPFLINKVLNSTPKNSIILYIDAGCQVNFSTKKSVAKFNEYISLAEKYGCVAFQTNHQELKFCKMDTYEKITGLRTSYQDYDFQYLGGICFLKNTDLNQALTKLWLNTCVETKYKYVNDSDSRRKNEKIFQEHRHDQSILSLYLKQILREGETLKTLKEHEHVYWGDNPLDHIERFDFPIWTTRNKTSDLIWLS